MQKNKKTLKEKILSPLERQITRMMLANYAVYLSTVPDGEPRISFEDWCMVVRDDLKCHNRDVSDFVDMPNAVPYLDCVKSKSIIVGFEPTEEASL